MGGVCQEVGCGFSSFDQEYGGEYGDGEYDAVGGSHVVDCGYEEVDVGEEGGGPD